jgi:hypothetical protein
MEIEWTKPEPKVTVAFYIDEVLKQIIEKKARELGSPKSNVVNKALRHVFAKEVAKISRSSSKA